ncbi:YeiH family protein [Marinobacter sp. JSM 1782161]|uniref:YeiH family protein n=1 Tax=Marinobacter sp. JSM 1782161 TaxID=2685906 RepID=UPI00140356DE|nr:YeiH family protein [Marinobacter sp. JSM 1782161]
MTGRLTHALLTTPHNPLPRLRHREFRLGLTMVLAVAAISLLLARNDWIASHGLSPLTLAVVLGIVLGNTIFPRIARETAAGVDFSKNSLLRLGIILYGFRITFQAIGAVGWSGVVADIATLTLTFALALALGRKVLGLDRETAVLIGAGSSICGAAAIMATEPVVRAPSHKVSVAVATVVVFGTLAMFLYPAMYPWLGLSEHAYGVYVGSTVHEVAQVVAAGSAIGPAAGNTAVIEKMLRVMMLAPFLLFLGQWFRRRHNDGQQTKAGLGIPWFAVIFLGVSALNSVQVVPEAVVKELIGLDTLLLTMAMTALGLRTHIGAIRQAGARPMVLGFLLFGFLVAGGYAINWGVLQLMA